MLANSARMRLRRSVWTYVERVRDSVKRSVDRKQMVRKTLLSTRMTRRAMVRVGQRPTSAMSNKVKRSRA